MVTQMNHGPTLMQVGFAYVIKTPLPFSTHVYTAQFWKECLT